MERDFRRRRALRHGLSLFGLVILAGNLAAHEAVVFERDVRPILLRGCGGIACHLNVASSGVSLKTFEDVMASEGLQYGGPIVIPGDPAASPLFDKIANDVPMFGFRMPFGGADPLTDAEIDTIREWIEDGAIQSHLLARGDVNQDDTLNVTDAVRILGFLFRGGEAPACPAQADVDADGNVNLTDPIFVLNFLFLGGPRPSRLSEEENEVCEEAGELSFESIYQNVFLTTCAFSSCHGGALPRAGLDLSTADAAYAALASVLPSNDVARAAGLLRVDPGTPDNSFLLKKLLGPGPGEGNRMPANSATPLSDAAIGAIREWILAGAPREGTIDGVSDIDEESPPSVPAVPQPPVPENGFQLHLGPFNVGARREREILSYAHQPFANLGLDEVVVRRIDIHMSEASHHFILYNWIGGGRPGAGLREVNSGVDIFNTRRFVVASQQAFFTLAFPEGVGLRFDKNQSFDLNSHYVNLSGGAPLQAEVYVNFFFAEPGSITTFVRPIFEINFNINVPPNATRTTQSFFPGPTTFVLDPQLGRQLGRVARETHIYSLTSHTHRHGIRFSAFRLANGRDADPPDMVYDNDSWDDPHYQVYEPMVLMPGDGLRFTTTHWYHDPPSPRSPALRFDVTSEDEMAILLGYYTVP